MHLPTVAFTDEMQVGDEVEVMGELYRITGVLTKEQFIADMHARRERDRRNGRGVARAGSFDLETKEFKPGQEVPDEMKYFYTVEKKPRSIRNL